MFKKIKNLWNLADYVPALDQFSSNVVLVRDTTLAKEGDSEFISQGSEEEFKEWEREQNGLKGIFGL